MKPKRIQLKRTKGWRMPANTVKVDRSTKWGNPWKVGGIFTAQWCVNRFVDHLELDRTGISLAADARRELRGKNLGCWCPIGSPCHADVLLEIANRP